MLFLNLLCKSVHPPLTDDGLTQYTLVSPYAQSHALDPDVAHWGKAKDVIKQITHITLHIRANTCLSLAGLSYSGSCWRRRKGFLIGILRFIWKTWFVFLWDNHVTSAHFCVPHPFNYNIAMETQIEEYKHGYGKQRHREHCFPPYFPRRHNSKGISPKSIKKDSSVDKGKLLWRLRVVLHFKNYFR